MLGVQRGTTLTPRSRRKLEAVLYVLCASATAHWHFPLWNQTQWEHAAQSISMYTNVAWKVLEIPEQSALGVPVWAGLSDQMTSRGLFQTHLVCDSEVPACLGVLFFYVMCLLCHEVNKDPKAEDNQGILLLSHCPSGLQKKTRSLEKLQMSWNILDIVHGLQAMGLRQGQVLVLKGWRRDMFRTFRTPFSEYGSAWAPES